MIIKRNINALGDTIMMSIIANTYKYNYPDEEVYLSIDSPLVYNKIFLNNFIDKIMPYEHNLFIDNCSDLLLGKKTCDLSSESSVYEESGIYIDRIYLSLLKLECKTDKVIKKKPNVFDNEFIPAVDVFVHCDSNDEKRQYAYWNLVIDWLYQRGLNVAYSFGKQCHFKVQKDFGNRSFFQRYSEEIELNDLIVMISKCKLFLGCDSGLMHVAGLLDINSLCLFGSTIPSTRLLYYPKTKYILSNVECIGCYNKDCFHSHKCMLNISVSEITNKIESEFNEILF